MVKIISLLTQGGFAFFGVLTPEQLQVLSVITDEVLAIALVVAISSIVIVLPMLLSSIKNKVETNRRADQWKLLEYITDISVRAAEQSFLPGDNTIKYDYVSKTIADTSKINGIKFINPEICRILIESSVNKYKISNI